MKIKFYRSKQAYIFFRLINKPLFWEPVMHSCITSKQNDMFLIWYHVLYNLENAYLIGLAHGKKLYHSYKEGKPLVKTFITDSDIHLRGQKKLVIGDRGRL